MAAERSPQLPTSPPPSIESRSWLHRRFQAWELNPTQGWFWVAAVFGAVITIAFLFGLGSIGLVDETEPLFAEAARQMIVRDDWVTPYFNEATRFDKPPLIYWLMAISYQLFGVNEWAVRLPSALSAIVLTGLVLYLLQRHGVPAFSKRPSPRYGRWLTALLGAGFTALNLETIAWARVGVSDMLLSGCFGSALATFFLGYATHQYHQSHWLFGFARQDRWFLLSYLFIALGILAKGPVAIVLPGVIVLGFLLYVGQFWNVFMELKPWRGLPLVALLTVPWYVLVIQANGEAYTRSFFGYHNFDRFTTTVNNHGAPWYFYFLVVLVGFAPWSLFLPAAIARLRLWQRNLWVKKPRSSQLAIFAASWFIGTFIFFTIAATKLPSYVLPLMPAGAILVALLFSDEMTRLPERRGADGTSEVMQRGREGLKIAGWLNFGFVLILAVAIASSYRWIQVIEDPAMPDFPLALRDSGLLFWGAAICAEVAIGIFLLIRQNRRRWLWSVNVIGFVALLLCVLAPATALMDQHRQAPLRQISETLIEQRLPNEELLMVAFEKPTVVFYTQRPMLFFRRTRSTFRHLQEFSLKQDAPDTVLILTQPNRLKRLGLVEQPYDLVEEAGSYVLLRVPKQTFRARLAQGIGP